MFNAVEPGDAPRVVIAPATIQECFHSVITARQIAETFRTVVMILSDANLSTGVQPFPRPRLRKEWLAPDLDLAPVKEGQRPYEWDAQMGTSTRAIPGQPGGMFTVTGLSHDERSKVAYGAGVHQHSTTMRSRKLAVLQQTLLRPAIHGDQDGDLLVVGWGIIGAPDVSFATATRTEGNVLPVRESDDGRDQLQRPARRSFHHRGEQAARSARDASSRTDTV